MGHQGETPSLEDDLCAKYIKRLLKEKTFDIHPYFGEIQQGPGSYFFSQDQWQYPEEDFTRCLETDRFNFAIQAILKGDYAILLRC
jgi:2-phosphosulfolactate phosphatase